MNYARAEAPSSDCQPHSQHAKAVVGIVAPPGEYQHVFL